jgi:hypothetical protein
MSSSDLMTRLDRIEGIADTQLDLTGKVSVGCHQMLLVIAQEIGVEEFKITQYERDLVNNFQFDFEGLLCDCREKLALHLQLPKFHSARDPLE